MEHSRNTEAQYVGFDTTHWTRRRLVKDFKQVQQEANAGFAAAPVSDDNIFVWEALIFGFVKCKLSLINKGQRIRLGREAPSNCP